MATIIRQSYIDKIERNAIAGGTREGDIEKVIENNQLNSVNAINHLEF